MLCRRASVARLCELSLISVRGPRRHAPLSAVAKSARPLLAFGSLGSANTAVAIHSADAGSIRNKPGARTLTRLTEERDMPVVRLLQNLKVTPEESARLVTAYEETLKALRLVDRSDPLAELVATKVIEIGQRGLLDPAEISRLALEELGSA
jgi:enamine deaminase RidA (YjgF/YER057c/UK114 family)